MKPAESSVTASRPISIGFLGFAIVPALVYIAWVIAMRLSPDQVSTVASFGLISLVAWILLLLEIRQRPFSLAAMNWFFIILFIGIAGLYQYVNDRLLYSNQTSLPWNVKGALLAVSIWMVAFAIASFFGRSKATLLPSTRRFTLKSNPQFIVFATIISLLVVAYITATAGFDIMFSRSSVAGLAQETSAQTQLVVALRLVPVYTFALSAIQYSWTHRYGHLILLQGIFVIISNSPIGGARFSIATVYLGLALLLIPWFRKHARFATVFLLAFIIIFPTINIFRNTSLNELTSDGFSSYIDRALLDFDSGDYDAFSMISYTQQYTIDNGFALGRQFLGPLFFFIPRQYWPTKPIGTGAHITESYGHHFTNVSAPLIAEGLINFGLIGVFTLALLTGYAVGRVDGRYWLTEVSALTTTSYLTIIYPFIIPLFFFMNRGDLLSTASFIVSHIVVFSCLFLLSQAGAEFTQIRTKNPIT